MTPTVTTRRGTRIQAAKSLIAATRFDADLRELARPLDGRLSRRQVDVLSEIAIAHGVGAFAHRLLQQVEGAPPAPLLIEWVARVAGRQLQIAHDLASVADALNAAEVPWVALKGVALAPTVYGRTLDRPYADLDLLVSPTALRASVTALTDLGGRSTDRNWRLMVTDRRGQIHLRLPAGTHLDLHWDLINSVRVRDTFRIRSMDALARRQPLPGVSAARASQLDPVDQLLHVAVHATVSGSWRLVWFTDIDRIVRFSPPDWDVVARRAGEWRCRAAVGSALLQSTRLMNTPVPEPVLSQLLPRSTRLAVRAIVGPHPAAGAGPVPARTVLLSSVRDRGFSMAIPRLHRWLTPQGARQAWNTWQRGVDWRDTALNTASGDLEQFLTAVDPSYGSLPSDQAH